MSNQGDDCYFFFYSTCTKGDSCAFRHCDAALGNEAVCTLWQEGRCFRQICKYRHMEIDKKRSAIPCYWEKQISGCQKANCAFHHAKERFVDGAYFPPNKALVKPESNEPDVQISPPSPAPTKLSLAPIPQLRGVKIMEATENVPSPTHPPVVINAADDDEDDDDQFSEDGEEMKSSVHPSVAFENQHFVSTRKSLTPKKDVDLNYGIKTLEEIKSEKWKDHEVAKNDPTASPEVLVSSNHIDNSISVLRIVKFTSKDSTTNLSLAQRLGKRKTFQRDGPLAASDGEVLPSVKKTLLERLGKRTTPLTDSPEFQPKKVPIPRLLKDRLGLPPELNSIETEAVGNIGTDFHIKTLQEIRQEKANQSLEQVATSLPSQREGKVTVKSKLCSKLQTAIYVKSLSEIQAEKRLRRLKDGVQKHEDTKDEKDSKADKEMEQKNYGNTTQNNTIPAETAPKQTGFNFEVQGNRKIKLPIVNDNISSNSGTTKSPFLSLKGPKRSLQSIEKVRVKTLEEIRQEKALHLQHTGKLEVNESVSQPQAPSNSKILRLSNLPASTDEKLDQATAEPSPHINKASDEENKTFRSPVKTSEKEQSKKSVDTETESSELIADYQMSPLKDGSDVEVMKPTTLILEKKEKPKLNVEPCVVKNTLPFKAAIKQKAQERTIVAEVKPMSSAVSYSESKKGPGILPVIESFEESSKDSIPPKRIKISSQANTHLQSASAMVQPTYKSPRTTTASMRKTSEPTEDEFDELMWEISDDKLEAELELDSNKDEDALLLELSKMIDS